MRAIETTLSQTDLLLAWWTTTHNTRGTYYKELGPMDSRTITHVRPDPDQPGHFLADLSDDSTAKVGSPIAGVDADGHPAVLLELRDGSGALSGDGPLLTEDVEAQLRALGVPADSFPVLAPAAAADAHEASSMSTPSTLIDVEKPVTIESMDHAAPIVVPPPLSQIEAHGRHAAELHRIAFAIERGGTFLLHEIVALIHAVV